MPGVVNLALSSLIIGDGLTLSGSTLSVTPATSVANTVVAASGSTLSLEGNGGAGASIVLGLGSTIALSGSLQGLKVRVNLQAGNYTVTSTDLFVVYTGAGSQSFTLPAASSNVDRLYLIKNRGTGTLTLACTGADEIFTTTNVSTFSLRAGEAAIVVCDGTYWNIVSLASGVIVP